MTLTINQNNVPEEPLPPAPVIEEEETHDELNDYVIEELDVEIILQDDFIEHLTAYTFDWIYLQDIVASIEGEFYSLEINLEVGEENEGAEVLGVVLRECSGYHVLEEIEAPIPDSAMVIETEEGYEDIMTLPADIEEGEVNEANEEGIESDFVTTTAEVEFYQCECDPCECDMVDQGSYQQVQVGTRDVITSGCGQTFNSIAEIQNAFLAGNCCGNSGSSTVPIFETRWVSNMVTVGNGVFTCSLCGAVQ